MFLLVATMAILIRNYSIWELPNVAVEERPADGKPSGTTIRIKGYNNNRREKFTHEILRDYVQWFTKVASFESHFNMGKRQNLVVQLKGLMRRNTRRFPSGTLFQMKGKYRQALRQLLVDAPHHYCKRILKSGQLPNHPEVGYQALFSIEGNKVKRDYNPMLRRKWLYGPSRRLYSPRSLWIWLCKDFIPVQRANEWISVRGTEYTRSTVFLMPRVQTYCKPRVGQQQPSELLKDIEHTIREVFDSITNSDDWRDMEWLESQADAHRILSVRKRI